MDVLGLWGDCADDDGLHLFRHSGDAAPQGKRPSPQLCRISVSELRISPSLCCSSARRAARLVALRSFQRLFLVGNLLPSVCADPASTRPKSPGGIAVFAEVEHCIVRLPALLVPLYSHYDHHSGFRVISYTRI